MKKSKEQFYEKQSHEQLVIFCKSHDRIEESLRKRLKLLSGCEDYGQPDGMNGSCVDCFYDNTKLWENAMIFVQKYIKMKCQNINLIDLSMFGLKPYEFDVFRYNIDEPLEWFDETELQNIETGDYVIQKQNESIVVLSPEKFNNNYIMVDE